MDKDNTEKRKILISPVIVNNSNNNIKLSSSIYRIKGKESIDFNNNDDNKDKNSVKIIFTDDKNHILDNEKYLEKEISNNKSNSRHNSKDSKNKKNNTIQNDRYQSFENENISDRYDEFSENSNPKEKPKTIKYKQIKDFDENRDNNLERFEEINKPNKRKNTMLRNSKNNLQLSYLQDDIPKTNEPIKLVKKNLNNDKNVLTQYYINFQKDIEKTNYFIIFFSIGITLSAISIFFCIFLQLYGNKDIYIILTVICFILMILYIFEIKLTYQYKNKVLLAIKKKEDPEKIIHSNTRKNLLLIIYFLIIAFNYYQVVLLVNTSFLNNNKLSIRGKGYDINQWLEFFSGKNYDEILKMFEKTNIGFLIVNWLNQILLLFILIFKMVLIFNYRIGRSIIQILCILAIQAGIVQIYLSIYCYKFRDVTSLEGIRLSWATPGTLSNGSIAIFLGIFGFYAFFMEDKKKIYIFQLICFCQIILLAVFAGGLSAIGDKLYNYKHATCNTLFKFISEEYLLRNKLNRCTSKYLFKTETLNNIQCPKDRIMINWERTEKSYENLDPKDDIFKEMNQEDEDSNIIYFGCINQSCCLQVYFDIKNKFDFLLILCIHLITYFIFIIIISCYINYKIKTNLDEEILEKKSLLFVGILTIFLYIIVLPYIFTLPKSSNQSVLNNIDNNKVSESLSIIDKDLTIIEKESLYQITNNTFNSVKNDLINNFKYNIVYNFTNKNDYKYELSYYEYMFSSSDLNIIINKKFDQLSQYDYNYYSFDNLTKILIFKSKTNLINEILNCFDLVPYHPLKNKILLNVDIKASFIRNENKNDILNNNNNGFQNIIITEENINEKNNDLLLITIINKELDFSIMYKDNLFYLKGNIIDDNGKSLINIYNYYYNNTPIYSVKTDINGYFLIGPLYRIANNKSIYYLNIEITKITNNNDQSDIEKYDEDGNYCKYYDLLKISQFEFHTNKFYSLNDIYLPKYEEGSIDITGKVIKYDEDNEPLSEVYIKVFYEEQINIVNELIENNPDSINTNDLDDLSISKTITDKNGNYSFNIKKSGQYMIVFIKNEYFIERNTFIIKNLSSSEQNYIGTMNLIKLFNSGKIIVKLEWNNKPPDLDLICRFQVTKENYCYTFFGNKKCVETEFYFDSREPNEISSEIIEINELSDYVYFFYVRKYFDNSNGNTQNEYKIEGIEDQKINYTDIDIKYDQNLTNTTARILVYTNGLKIHSLKISIPGFLQNEKNQTKHIYWAAFCINGKEGINSLKIINEFAQNEPPKNICLSYYDINNLITFE